MNRDKLLIGSVAVILAVAVFFGVYSVLNRVQPGGGKLPTAHTNLTRFTSEKDFLSYISESSSRSASYSLGLRTSAPATGEFLVEDIGSSVGLGTADTKTAPAPERISETNVQVEGIDEPDIVKTDGTELYISSEAQYYYGDIMPFDTSISGKLVPPQQSIAKTKLVRAFPVDSMKMDGSVDTTGNLLIVGKTMIVFGYSKMYGYDVTDPASPKEIWTNDLGTSSKLVTARLKDGSVYLVVRNNLQNNRPCPYDLLKVGTRTLTILCAEIYHPVDPSPVDGTYTAMIMDPKDGSIGKKVSFVGSSTYTTVYMSENALYVAYTMVGDFVAYMYNFLNESAKDLVSSDTLERLKKLMALDISSEAKMVEFEVIMNRFQAGLTNDDQMKMETEMANRMKSYGLQHQREFERSGIAKITLDSMSIASVGDVPGHLLNQFSLDENGGMLRVATTSGDSFLTGSSEQSVNDVYVLDGSMKIVGSVLDLGKGERIYSVRFVGGQGYVVTFRQIDPFYVLDLRDPRDPKLTGELKIPGYSSYLDKLTDTLVLGVGEDRSKVKLTLFDVSDPANPKDLSTYQLDEYWTGIQSNHHAFLHDAKHKVFFIPSSKGSYVISYDGGTLSLKKAVSGYRALRAVYLDDFLYIVAADKVTILNESDWQQAKELLL
ncbi:MAG: beta-propeller domain-containing protein [Candidatus Kerfeldbacteria bacterium]